MKNFEIVTCSLNMHIFILLKIRIKYIQLIKIDPFLS